MGRDLSHEDEVLVGRERDAIGPDEVVTASAAGPATRSGWDRAEAACHAFLDACLDRGVQRIFLFDAPAVLEPDPAEEDRLLELARASFAELFGPDERASLDPAPVASALRGLAFFVARADDPGAARRRAGAVVSALLAGLRRRSDGR